MAAQGATLSDKTARKEFGLTQEESVQTIHAGKLHYREASMQGNPWLPLLRREVEALVEKKHGRDHQKEPAAKTELARINRELVRLNKQIAALELRKSQLQVPEPSVPPRRPPRASVVEKLRALFPGCPAGREQEIAEHACMKYSGRVGRTAAAKTLDEEPVCLAVRAHLRPRETRYDARLARGLKRHGARTAVRAEVERILEEWRGRHPCSVTPPSR